MQAVHGNSPGGINYIIHQRVVHRAVEPHILGPHVFRPGECPLLSVVYGVAVGIADHHVGPVGVLDARSGPVPGHCRSPPAGKCRDVAALAANASRVQVQTTSLCPGFVWRGAMTAFATLAVRVVLGIISAGDLMRARRRLVTLGAREIPAVHTHVDIQLTCGIAQRGVQVAMLDGVSATAEEVTCATGIAAGLAHIAGNPGEVHGRIGHAAEDIGAGPGPRGARGGGEFLISAGGVMAHQAVHLGGVGEIESLVFDSPRRCGNWCSAARSRAGPRSNC